MNLKGKQKDTLKETQVMMGNGSSWLPIPKMKITCNLRHIMFILYQSSTVISLSSLRKTELEFVYSPSWP